MSAAVFRQRLREGLPALLPVALALALFARTVPFAFLNWDDAQLITENPLVRTFSPAIFWTYDPELYIPLTLLTYQIEHAVAGFWAPLFHLTNITLHALNVWLAFLLLRHLTQKDSAASLGAMLFAVHPLVVEPVAWISGRKEMLWTAFALLSILFFLRAPDRRPRSLLPSLGCFLCALLSKVTAVVLPLLLPVLDGLHRRQTMKTLRSGWPYAALAVVFAGIAIGGKSATFRALQPIPLLLLLLQSAGNILRRIFLPFHLSAVYPVDPSTLTVLQTVPAILGIAIIVAIAWLARRRLPLVTAGLLWCGIALLPGLLAYRRSNELTFAADRYAYMALIGVAMLLSGLLTTRKNRPALLTIAVILIAGCSALAWQRVHVWSSTETLFADVLRTAPDSVVARNNLGHRLLQEGKFTEAETVLRQALDRNPDFPDALVNLAVIAAKRGDLDEAERLLRQALTADPRHAQAHFNLAGVYFVRGENDQAAAEYRITLSLKPGYEPALRQLEKMNDEP